MAQSTSSNRKTAQRSLRAAAEDLAGEIATLNTIEPTALLQKWKALFGGDPSAFLARIFMVRAVAYGCRSKGSAVSSHRRNGSSTVFVRDALTWAEGAYQIGVFRRAPC